MKSQKILLVTFLVIPLLFNTHLTAQNFKWEHLGSRKVNFGVDKDVIPVTWREGKFNAIKIVVTGGNLNMHKCIIHFENGGTQDVELRHNFSRGSDSRVIDLPGNNRFIEKVVFWYDTKNFSRRRATVSVFGRH